MKPGTIVWIKRRQKIELDLAIETDVVLSSLMSDLQNTRMALYAYKNAIDFPRWEKVESIQKEIEERVKFIKLAHGILDE